MNIIFLDIDGVLNSRRWNKAGGHFQKEFDKDAVERLNKILRAVPDTHIVISSTWKLSHTQGELMRMLRKFGLEGNRTVIGVTPGAQTKTASGIILANGRGEEILAWLKVHKDMDIDSFIAIDDDAYDMDPVITRLVKTDFEYGLLDYHVNQAIKLLKTYAYKGVDNEVTR